MDPLVSIVIPTFNRGREIFHTLDSIVNQSYPAIEIVVVDDGSTDDTQEMIHKYIEEKSLQHKLFYHRQKNKGAPSARNLGLKEAKGNLVVFFDSDDLMLPERIYKQVKTIELENSDACSCGFRNSEDGKVFIPRIEESLGNIGSLIYWKLMGSTQSWMYKRNILEKIDGYDLSFACYQDWDLTFRYLIQCEKISIVTEVLSIFNNEERTDRITSQIISNRRISNIQKYYSKIIVWLLKEGKNHQILNDVVFMYVHQITLAYYKTSGLVEAKKSYQSFNKILKGTSLSTSLWCRLIFFKHLIKTSLKNLLINFNIQSV